MKILPFWVAALGGILLAVTFVTPSPTLVVVGAGIFVLGVLLFFSAAVQRGRAEGVGPMTALGRGARDALRFAWHLMP